MRTLSAVQQGAMISVDEAWSRIGKDKISRAAMYLAVKRREIPCIRIGRRVLIVRDAFDDLLSSGGISADKPGI